MMQQQMPTQLPEGLAALLSLTSAMQQGRVAPTTPDGQPTVAAQAAKAAQQQMGMPPGPKMQDVAQGAGMAAQQQAQQQQEMMQKLPQMIAAMQQRQQAMDQGIAAAPGAQSVNMAEGGIVGYAGGPKDGSLVQYNPSGSAIGSSSGPRLLPTTTGYEGMSIAELIKALVSDPTVRENIQSEKNLTPQERLFLNEPRQTIREEGDIEDANAIMRSRLDYLSTPTFKFKDPLKGLAALTKALENPNMPESERRGVEAEIARIKAALEPKPDAEDKYDALKRAIGNVGNVNLAQGLGALAQPGEAPTRPGAPSFSEADAAYQRSKTERAKVRGPLSPEEALAAAQAQSDIDRKYLIARGLDPDRAAKEVSEYEALYKRRGSELEEQQKRIDANKLNDQLLSFLLGAKGRTLGSLMGSGAVSSIATERDIEQRQEALRKAQFDLAEARANKVNALNSLREATAKGDFKAAVDAKNAAIKASNDEALAQAKLEQDRASELSRRSESEATRQANLYGTDVTAYTAAQNRAQQAALESARMSQHGAIENARMNLQVELERLRATPKDITAEAAIERAVNSNQRLQAIKASVAEIMKDPTIQNKQAVMASLFTQMRDIENEIRRIHNRPEILDATSSITPPTFKYDPKTGLQPGK